jgi:type VI secretion system protein ImpB
MTESTQHKLDRVRPPRVQITYDVEIGDAIETRELPFVMGIMADLSGDRDPEKAVRALRDRKFVEIDRDNFNGVMVDADPRIAAQVPNKLDGTNTTQLNVVIHF